jgi:hypothetical protein
MVVVFFRFLGIDMFQKFLAISKSKLFAGEVGQVLAVDTSSLTPLRGIIHHQNFSNNNWTIVRDVKVIMRGR